MTDNTKDKGEAPPPTIKVDNDPNLTALRRVNLHAQTIEAIEAMAFEGLPIKIAADRHNVPFETLNAAFKRAKVKRAFNQVVAAIRNNAAQAAYIRINHMSATAESERLRFDANRWVAGVDGISPVTKVAGQVNHTHSFAGFEYPDLIDGKASPVQPEGDADEDD